MITPELSQVIREAIERVRADIHTAMPGEIVSYDATTQTADVQPCLQRKYGDGEVVTLPVIPKVPVVFQRGGGAYISFPLAAGDPVTLFFSERSLDRWKVSGGVTDPADARKHNLSDAFCMPGLYPMVNPIFPPPSTTDLVIALENDSAKITIKPDGAVTVESGVSVALGSESPSDFVALASKVDQALSAINTWANSHTHLGNLAVPTGPAVPPLSPASSVASEKVKSD